MVNAVNGAADGSLKGVMKVYTALHVLHCTKCRTALHSLKSLHSRLGELAVTDTGSSDGIGEAGMANLESALDGIDRKENTRTR